MGVNAVEYDGKTLIDLSGDTITEDTLVEGVTAHDANGNPILGKFGIKSIEKTATQGLVDTYTITLTNGRTFTYQIINGKSAYEYAKDGGYTGTEDEFCKMLSISYIPDSRRINGKTLDSDIELSAADVGAYSTSETDEKIASELGTFLRAYITSDGGAIDKLQEIADWIDSDKNGAADIIADVEANKTAVTEESKRATKAENTLGNRITALEEIDHSLYQTKSDDTLTTESKEVVGAINELHSKAIIIDINTVLIFDGGSPADWVSDNGLVAGLYDEDGNMTYSWDTLVAQELVIEGGVLTAHNYELELSGTLVIHDSITEIGEYALDDTGITVVVIPVSVTKIASYAFYYTYLDRIIYEGDYEQWRGMELAEYWNCHSESAIIEYSGE